MKHLTFNYTDKTAYKKAKKEALKTSYNAQLIQLFCATTDKKQIKKILKNLTEDFPNALLIGTTTAGEISHAKMYENEIIISLSLFKKTKLQVHRTKSITAKDGAKLSKKICTKDTKAAIILSEGLQGEDYEGFIKGVKHENPNVILAGGLAGDNFQLKQTYIFLGKEIYDTGAVGVSFSSKNLLAKNEYNLNWNPIGKEFTITKAEGNILYEIDGQNAIELMKHYLGRTLFENNCASLPDFPILYKEGNTLVSRTPMTTDNDSIVLAGPIQTGQKVQFGFSNAPSIISGANKITQELNKKPAQAIYIYSCIARKTLLGKKLEAEFAPFEHLAPTAGFFTYGEFYSTDIDNALLNCTTTILVLSEEKKLKKKKKLITKQESTLDSTTFNALTHFIKQTASELQENAALLEEYKVVVDESSLVSKTDLEGKITYVNDTFCKISKYKREELLGQSHNIIRDPKMSNFIFKKLWGTVSQGKVWKGFISNRAKDGSIYYVEATIMPIFDMQNEIKEFIAIRQDITKQIESKKRIQGKEKLIKAIFDNQDAMVISTTKEQGMLSVNRKLFDVLEFNSFREFKGKHICICDLFIVEKGYVSVADNPDWLDEIAEADNNEQYKVKIKIQDGTVHTFTIFIKKIDAIYIINLNDITQLEKAVLKANASERAKSLFLANMSHEIRTPLNGILGFTDILTQKDFDTDTKRYIDIIHKSGQTLLHVVNDILDFSKIESGELSLYTTESNLFKEMEATVSTFASLSKQKHINYYVFIDTALPKKLNCDAQRIKQVLNNLISNAIKFTPNNGEVNVKVVLKSIANKKAKIHFSIKDSGIGIAKKKQKSVFDAFSQADDSISREFGGTGLGLAISNQYINMMDSQIQLHSKENSGSEFFFDLELDITDPSLSIDKTKKDDITLSILQPKNSADFMINKIIFSYLDAWGYTYHKIHDLAEMSEDTDIVIICEKLFNATSCKNILDTHSEMQLIYIEGINETFSCTHKNFHTVSQPMTGSALFDKIITSTQKHFLEQNNEQKNKEKQFRGTILIAEDNETNQLLISILLKQRGIEFTIVSNGQEAVDEAHLHAYDLIFMDINMPILDGIGATKALREKSYTGKIISLSANVIDTDILSYQEAGIDDSLNKPIIPDELDHILTKHLTKKITTSMDSIDVQNIANLLRIDDKSVVLSLLHSFASSIKEIQTSIVKEGLNEDILHNLKGMVGNLHFLHFQTLLRELEANSSHTNQAMLEEPSEKVLQHIKSLLKQISKL